MYECTKDLYVLKTKEFNRKYCAFITIYTFVSCVERCTDHCSMYTIPSNCHQNRNFFQFSLFRTEQAPKLVSASTSRHQIVFFRFFLRKTATRIPSPIISSVDGSCHGVYCVLVVKNRKYISSFNCSVFFIGFFLTAHCGVIIFLTNHLPGFRFTSADKKKLENRRCNSG